jgi:Domain of unknown function (DUF397)
MNSPEQTGLRWIKATKSYGASACVELAPSGEFVLLRDSKNPHVLLSYSPAEIDAFLDGVKRGEFDHLVQKG